MFPIPWNFPFRKKNGDMSTIGAEIGGAGSELPPHSSSDAGKLLGVKPNGSLEWSDTVNSEIQTLTNNLSDEVETRAKLGAHNIFPLTIDDLKSLNTINGTWSGNSFTMYGITYNCEVTNGYVSKITVSGTSTATSTLELFGKYAAFASNKYKGNILSGCPSGGSGTSYCILEQTSASSAGTSPAFSRDEGSGVVIGDNDYARLYIRIEGGYAISGSLIFNPMIRLASDTDPTYAPYAKTNRELTEVIKGELTGDVIFTSNSVVKQNNIVTINAVFEADKDYVGFTQIVNIPSGFRPLNINPTSILACDNNNTIIIPLTAFPDGKIQGSGALVTGYYYRFSMTYIIA